MSTISLPQARIPLGQVNVPGHEKPLQVTIDIEWMRALLAIVARTGGVSAPDIDVTALLNAINAKPVLFSDAGDDDSWAMPGAPGAQGLQGPPGVAMWGQEGEQGDPGMTVPAFGGLPLLDLSPTWNGVHTFRPLTGVKLHDAQITSAGAAVYARIANGSNAANSAAVLCLDASSNGFGVRDCQIRATNNGSNAVTLSFWTVNGGAPVERVNISPLGQLKVLTGGLGLSVAEGANAKQGTATLVGGTVTVNNTSVTANSRIFLTIQSLGTVAAPKAIAVTARTAATSFVITSADATDTSVIAYFITEPA